MTPMLLLLAGCLGSTLAGCGAGVAVSPTASALPATSIPSATSTSLPSPTPSATPLPLTEICFPLSSHTFADLPNLISWQFDPTHGVDHYGLDLAHWQWGQESSSLDDPVQAVMDSWVAGIVRDRPPSGNMIILETPYEVLPSWLITLIKVPVGDSVYHQYAHLAQAPDLQIGDPVSCGQEFGRVGLTGATLAPHLHLEMRIGPPGFTFNTMAYYTADATPEEITNYETWFINGEYQAFDPLLLLAAEAP